MNEATTLNYIKIMTLKTRSRNNNNISSSSSSKLESICRVIKSNQNDQSHSIYKLKQDNFIALVCLVFAKDAKIIIIKAIKCASYSRGTKYS
jgi:hypothetical protein